MYPYPTVKLLKTTGTLRSSLAAFYHGIDYLRILALDETQWAFSNVAFPHQKASKSVGINNSQAAFSFCQKN